MNSCTIPSAAQDVNGDGRWQSMHNRYVQEAKTSESEVLFIGDSIIQQLQFSTIWTEKIISLHCLNFGIGGDRVENVLWRIKNGELDFHVQIKAVVVMVGTNNVNNTANEIYDGIVEIVKVIREKLENVHIVLPTLLPRGQYPNPNRERISDVNSLLMKNYGKNGPDGCDTIHVVPIHEGIVQSDQTISHYVLYDYLHLTDVTYTKAFEPVYEKLSELLDKELYE